MKTKLKRSILIPAALLVYLIAMVAVFGRRMYVSGQHAEFYLITAVSLLVIVVLYFVLRQREKINEKQNQEERGEQNNR